MTAIGRPPRLAPRAWIVLILLAAAGLRLVALGDVPPGMTHDEADHGLTALSILDGARALYFPIGYGREPLYDYATAVVMRATGPTILAARLTSVYFSLLLIAAVYAWARRAFGAPVALLTAAGLAGGFWPLMTARQALRSGALPAVWALAVLFFWVGVFPRVRGRAEPSPQPSPKGRGGSPPLPRSSLPWPPARPVVLHLSAGAGAVAGVALVGCLSVVVGRVGNPRYKGSDCHVAGGDGRGRAAAALSGGAAGVGGACGRVERPAAGGGRRRLRPAVGQRHGRPAPVHHRGRPDVALQHPRPAAAALAAGLAVLCRAACRRVDGDCRAEEERNHRLRRFRRFKRS
ncbi:MAG: glycosyltransferase family 39 protein [Candidatus Promineofilum sp.]|nr:glycosyltransferase family 39 protein [Promineifilum sp.]